jgi:hypothetical protein
MVKVEKDVPLPRTRQEYKSFPWLTMEIGDSFYVHDIEGDNSVAHRLQTQISYMKRHDDTRRYTCRRDANGIRCWRTQ